MPNATTAAISARRHVNNRSMKKIICIGECELNIVFDGAQPVGAMPGGRICAAAALMAADGLPVEMASEASADPVGNMVVDTLTSAGVGVNSLDRFTEGRTPVTIFTEDADGTRHVTRYEDYAEEAFDIVWPKVDDSCVVVYGGYYALDRRMRPRMVPFLNHCAEMGAVMVYVPGFMSNRESRITRVMPAILENLELAHIVIARTADLSLIFGLDTDDKAYADHIDFYCRSMISVDIANAMISYFSGKEVTRLEIPAGICSTMTWNAGVVAGVASAIFSEDITPGMLDTPDESLRQRMLTAAARSAETASKALVHEWQKKI